MNILIVSATNIEILPLLNFLDIEGTKLYHNHYSFLHHQINILISGPGMMCMTFSLTHFCLSNSIDFAINAGIGGAFDKDCILGAVYNIGKDRIADLGAENPDGTFQDIFDMNLLEKNFFPFKHGWLYPINKNGFKPNLPFATGISVNQVSGRQETINRLRQKYGPDVESMEGAAFLYVCNVLKIPSVQIRAISNYVEPRNKENWKINDAVENLNNVLISLLKDEQF